MLTLSDSLNSVWNPGLLHSSVLPVWKAFSNGHWRSGGPIVTCGHHGSPSTSSCSVILGWELPSGIIPVARIFCKGPNFSDFLGIEGYSSRVPGKKM